MELRECYWGDRGAIVWETLPWIFGILHLLCVVIICLFILDISPGIHRVITLILQTI